MDDNPGQFPPPPTQPPLMPPPPLPDYAAPYGSAPGPGGPYPLDMGRIFEMTFSLFRFRWLTYLAAAFAIMIPVAIVFALGSLYSSDAALDWYAQFQNLAVGQAVSLTGAVILALAVGVVIGAFFTVGVYVAEAAVTHAAFATYNGQPAGVRRSVRFAVGRIGALGVAYLVTLLVTVGIVFLGVFTATLLFLATSSGGRITQGPGVFFGLLIFVAAFALLIFVTLRWTLIVPVMVVEGLGGVAALRRSWHLVSGSTWRVLGYVLVFALVFGLIAGVLTLALTVIVNPASLVRLDTLATDPVRATIVSIGSSMISVLVMPFTAIGMMLLYLDLRWRRGESLTPETDVTAIPPEAPYPPEVPGPPTF